MKTLAIVTFAIAALALGLDKVRNEHRMTEMYERQAVALERIADAAHLAAVKRIEYDLKNLPPAKKLPRCIPTGFAPLYSRGPIKLTDEQMGCHQ